MPHRNKKPCSKPGCPKLVAAGQTYCNKHKKEYKSRRNKKYDREKRDKKISKFYSSSTWKKIRDRYIKKNPLCEICKEKGLSEVADEVDHIVRIKVNWSKRFNSKNLQSLCHKCHMKKSAKDREKYDL